MKMQDLQDRALGEKAGLDTTDMPIKASETSDIDILIGALENRLFVYRYLWRLFAAAPDVDFLSVVADPATLGEIDILTADDTRGHEAQRMLCAIAHKIVADESPNDGRSDEHASVMLSRLTQDFTDLFYGPGKLPAPPYESVYLSDEDLIFQESTLRVRDAYRAAGYTATAYPHEPDDNLATELDFMAKITAEALETASSPERKDATTMLLALQTSRSFLEEHLAGWVPAFSDRMRERIASKNNTFYPWAAQLAARVCAADLIAVDELISAASAILGKETE